MKKVIIALLLVTALLAMSFVGCQKPDEPEATPEPKMTEEKKAEKTAGLKETAAPVKTEEPGIENPAKTRDGADDTMVVGCEGVKGIFSPLYYSSSYDGWVVDMIFEPLFTRDDKGVAYGVLADSWDVSEDNLTFTFYLNKDAKFSDGTDVTAADVEHTFLALADPSYDGRYGDTVAQLAGYDAYHAEGSTLEAMEGIKVIDDDTIAFTFAEVLRTNFNKLSFGIVSEAAYPYTKGNTAGLHDVNATPVGSGPYVLSQYEPDQFAKVSKNADHRDAADYAIPNVVIKAVESSTELAEMLAGDVDMLPGVVETDKRLEAEASGYIARVEYPRSGFGYLKYNCNEASPTGDPLVRQALSYAYNAEEVMTVIYEDPASGYTPAMTQPIPMSQVSWGYTDSLLSKANAYDFDPEMAKTILDQAGWTLGDGDTYRTKDGKELEIRVPAMPDHPIWDAMAPLLVDYWAVALNIKLTLEYVEFNTILDYIIYKSDEYVDKWDVFFLATTASTYDPDVYYGWFHSKYIGVGQDNTNQYRNAEVDRLLDEARKIIDEVEAAKVYEEIYLLINADQPVQVVYSNLYCDLVNTRISGLETGPIHDWTAELKDLAFAE